MLITVIFTGCSNKDITGSNNSNTDTLTSIESKMSDSQSTTDYRVIRNTPQETEANKIVEIEGLSKYFIGYDGCFILFDKNKNQYSVFNKTKSQKQVSPCSTFKIISSLIGLETNVLEDENTILKWDGKEYPISSWNRDQTLKSAVTNSVVWYFQIVASKVYDYKLFVSKKNVDIVKSVITLSSKNGIQLSGKTGSGGKSLNDKYINGWFVGYVQIDKDVYFFATNIEANETTQKSAGGTEAKEITLKILKDKKLL